MAIPTPSQTIINPQDAAVVRNQIALATANGGVYIFETTSNIYVTAVEENVSQNYG
jgi:hypothetical protein